MRSSIIILFGTLACVSFSLPVKRNIIFGGPRCYKMESDFCADANLFPPGVRMNTTVSVSDRAITERALGSYGHLIDTECAAELKKFLCFAYYPMCLTDPTGKTYQIKPCRSSCLAVREKCQLFVSAAGQTWPDALDCDALEDGRLCMPVTAPPPAAASGAAEPVKCEDCKIKSKPSDVSREICDSQSTGVFVKARILAEEVVGDGKSLLYNVQMERVLSGKSESSDAVSPKEQSIAWVITTSREDCNCHQLRTHQSYLLGLQARPYGDKILYVLDGEAVVSEWQAVKDVEKQIENCPQQ